MKKTILLCDVCEKGGPETPEAFTDRIATERVTVRWSSGGKTTCDLCAIHVAMLVRNLGITPGSRRQAKTEDEEYECPVCLRRFQSRSGIAYHMGKEHGEHDTLRATRVGGANSGRYEAQECPHCGETMGSPQGLSLHIKAKHPMKWKGLSEATRERRKATKKRA